MNTLQKCIDELKKEQPDIRYILGMLETYLEIAFVTPDQTHIIKHPSVTKILEQPAPEEMTPEEKEYYAKMAGGSIAPMHEQ